MCDGEHSYVVVLEEYQIAGGMKMVEGANLMFRWFVLPIRKNLWTKYC